MYDHNLALNNVGFFCNETPGMPSYIRKNIPEINATGLITIEQCNITIKASTTGMLTCKDSVIEMISATGNSNLYNTTINSEAMVTGLLSANLCHFKGPLIITSNEIILKKTITKNIIINDQSPSSNQQLELDGTKVEGDITFSSQKGIIILKNGASITGKIIGSIEIINNNPSILLNN